MKIGIITISKVDNYGAELQAYALFRVLQNLGHSVEIIDYLYYKHPHHIAENMSRPISYFSTLERIKLKLKKYAMAFLPYIDRPTYLLRQKRFESFYENINYSKTYRSMSSLYEAKHDYDVVITGSDQVWNPGTMSNITPFFLTFVTSNTKKIAYASSFGVSEISAELLPIYKAGLNNFDVLSCREKDGVELIKKITDKAATHVLDPTLLLNKQQWLEVGMPCHNLKNQLSNRTNPYILIYTLEDNAYVMEIAEHFKKSLGLEIVKINTRHITSKNNSIDYNIKDGGPSEFVYLLSQASLVLTTSFHGTAFAINFERPFFTILSDKKKNNSRQIGLLEKVGLKNRIIFEGTNTDDFPEVACDFKLATVFLNKEKDESFAYLRSGIDNK